MLLALTAWGQSQATPTGTTATTGDGSTQSQPQAQPVNPLQDTGQTQPAATQDKANTNTTFDPGTSGGNAMDSQDQQLGEIRLMTRYSQVGGDQTRSFKVPGENDLAEFNYFSDRRFILTRRIQVLSMFRATDDKSIDPEHDSLQKAYVRIFGPRDEYIIGDALVNNSRLSFNQNIKGFSMSNKLGENWKLSSATGVFIDRWGSLYKDLPGRPYTSMVAALRLERKIFRESTIGVNYSNSMDLLSTLPFANNGTSPLPGLNRVATIDSKLNFKSVRIDGEYAYSFTDFDRRFNPAGCAAPCDTRVPEPGLNRMQGDWGGRLEGTWRFHRLSVRSSYVRYEPNFDSFQARQIADLQDFVFRTSYDLTNWLSVEGTARRSNNDLKKQLPFQTTLWGPEGRLLFHDLGFYPKASLEVGYRHRIIESSNNSVQRFVRMPYAELTIPVQKMFLTLGYERRQQVDHIALDQGLNTNRVYAGLRGIFDMGNWEINPTFRYELEREAHRPGLALTPVNPLLQYDSNRLGMAGLYIQAPKYFIFEGSFRSSSATIFGPTGFSRPAYKTAITYKYHNDENTQFIFGFERANNYFYTSPNYDERVWSGTILYRFGHHAQ